MVSVNDAQRSHHSMASMPTSRTEYHQSLDGKDAFGLEHNPIPQFGEITSWLHVNDGTFCTVTEGKSPFRIVSVNESWLDSCGFRRKQVLGQTAKIM